MREPAQAYAAFLAAKRQDGASYYKQAVRNIEAAAREAQDGTAQTGFAYGR